MDQWNDSFVTTKAEVGRILTLGTCLHQCSFTALVSSAAKNINININHKGSSPTMNTLQESSCNPPTLSKSWTLHGLYRENFFKILHQLSLAVYTIVFEGVLLFSKVVQDFWTINSMTCSSSLAKPLPLVPLVVQLWRQPMAQPRTWTQIANRWFSQQILGFGPKNHLWV